MTIGVVVPTYNELSKGNLENGLEYFNSLSKNPLLDVVIVDDGSTDGSQAVINEYFSHENPEANIIYRKENDQKVGAMIDGMKKLDSKIDYVVLTDFDTKMKDYSVSKLEDVSKKMYEENIGGAAFKLTTQDNSLLTKIQKYEYIFERSLKKFIESYRNSIQISGAGGMWKRNVLDEIFPMHSGEHEGDDKELSILAKKHGHKIEYFPEIVVETRVPETYRSLIEQRKRWARGGLGTFSKYGYDKYNEFGDNSGIISNAMRGALTWLNWVSLPSYLPNIYNAIENGDPSNIFSLYAAQVGVYSAFILGGKEKINKKEALGILPFMPFYQAAVTYPIRVSMGGALAVKKIKSLFKKEFLKPIRSKT